MILKQKKHYRLIGLIIIVVATLLFESTLPHMLKFSPFPNYDKVIHFIVFGCLAVLLARLIETFKVESWWKVFSLSVLVTVLIGTVNEYVQSHTRGRDASFDDLFADLEGALVFLSVRLILLGIKRKKGFNSLTLKQKLLIGGIWVFIGKLTTGIAQILIAMLLARMLSPEDFGSFQVIQRMLLLLALVGSFGMAWVIVRRIAEGLALEQPEKVIAYVKSIFLIILVMTTFISCLFYAFGGFVSMAFFNINIDGLLATLIILIFCLSLQQVIPEGFRGLHDLKFASLFSGAATNTLMLIFFLISYFLLAKQISLANVLFVYAVSLLIIIGVSGIIFLRRVIYIKDNITQAMKESVMKDSLVTGIPLTLTGLLSFFVSQADVWIVAALFSLEDAAYYAAASRLVFVVSAPVMVANGATRGVIADLWAKKDNEKLQKLLRTVASLTVLFAILPASLFMFFGEEVLGLLYGSLYEQAAGILLFLVLGQLVLLAGGPAGTLMILSGYQKQVLYFELISAVVFALCAYFFADYFGLVGVAVASALAISIKTLLTIFFVRYSLNIKTYMGKISFLGRSL